jgi:hypothetical protein
MFITLKTLYNPGTKGYDTDPVLCRINTDHIVSVLITDRSFTVFLSTGNRLQFGIDAFGTAKAFYAALDVINGGIQ